MSAFPEALGLTSAQVEQALALAGAAPSLHNAQPWSFRVRSDVVELHADPARRLPIADPSDRELRIGCGAALLNLRLAVEHLGVRPLITLNPAQGTENLTASVRSGGSANPSCEQKCLYRAISERRTNRHPFLPNPVSDDHRFALVRAVQSERSWLHVVQRTQSIKLADLVRRAHDVQETVPGFREEWAHWTGLNSETTVGVPASAAGPLREAQDEWVLRDFSGGTARTRVLGKDFEYEPLLLVLCSYSDTRLDDIQAGQALQRMLLTATALGLSASFMSQVVEVPETRQKVRTLVGGSLFPQAVLRVGYGSPVPATPRRSPSDLLMVEPREPASAAPKTSETSKAL